MEALAKKVEQNLNGWPPNFPREIPKSKFFRFLKEYQEIVKYIPKTEYNKDADESYDSSFKNSKTDVNGSENALQTGKPASLGKTVRIQKIEQLHEKVKALSGKSLNAVGTLKRKGLKNRLKKKLKLEERMNAKRKKNCIKQNKVSNVTMSVKEQKKENIETKQDEVVYSKFHFPDVVDEDSKKKKGPRDPMRILQKVEKSRKKLREMEAKGRNEKVKEIKGRLAWEAAIKKAEGQKVKDDIELLKKSINKKKNAKNRSKKKWEERENNKVQKMDDAQKKRKTNIQNKKKEKQKKKLKKLIKKGRIVT